MTSEQWLAARPEQPPAALAEAIRAALPPMKRGEQDRPAGRFTAAASQLLPQILAGECKARSGALDLLTLDALLSYAMEAASSTAQACERAASEALDAIGDAAAATLDAIPRVLS